MPTLIIIIPLSMFPQAKEARREDYYSPFSPDAQLLLGMLALLPASWGLAAFHGDFPLHNVSQTHRAGMTLFSAG